MSGNLGNVRLYLWAALALVLFYDYQAWMHDYAPPAYHGLMMFRRASESTWHGYPCSQRAMGIGRVPG